MSEAKVACVDETKALAKCLNGTECIKAGYSSRECLTEGRSSECDVSHVVHPIRLAFSADVMSIE